MITTLTPIIVAIVVCLMFKETRWLAVVLISLLSYFFTIPFLVLATAGGLGFCYWKFYRG